MPPQKNKSKSDEVSSPHTLLTQAGASSTAMRTTIDAPLQHSSGLNLLSPKPIMITDLSDLFTNITASFISTFNSCMDKVIEAIERKLNHRLDVQEVQTFDINKRMDSLEKTIHDREGRE